MYYRPLIPVLLCLIVVAACNADRSPETKSAAATVVVEDTAVPVSEDIYANIYAWQGNLDGRYPVLMWYRLSGDVVSGSLFYTDNKTGDSIRLIGTANDSTASIREFMPDGTVTGIWNMELHSSAAEGTWFSPKTKRVLSASLMHIDTAITIKDIAAPKDVSGTYHYSYKTEGRQGTLQVKQKGKYVTVRFDNVTGGPAYNIASIDTITLALNDNEAIYKTFEYGDCIVSVRFYTGFAVVNYKDEKDACGFGHNATVDGVYIKLKNKEL